MVVTTRNIVLIIPLCISAWASEVPIGDVEKNPNLHVNPTRLTADDVLESASSSPSTGDEYANLGSF